MMPCTNMVEWVDARRKGSGKPYRKVKKHHSWWSTYLGQEVPEGMVPCKGAVKIEISVGHGCPCCSGPEVEIEYECDACGGTFYPELPSNTGDLEDLLNEGVITKAKNKKMQAAYVAAHEEAEAKRAKYLKEQEERFAKNRAKAAEKKKLIAEAKAARKKKAKK
jgi:hypothetical protein